MQKTLRRNAAKTTDRRLTCTGGPTPNAILLYS